MYQKLVFIDSRVADAEILLAGFSADAQVVWLDLDRDGLFQAIAVFAGHQALSRFSVFCLNMVNRTLL